LAFLHELTNSVVCPCFRATYKEIASCPQCKTPFHYLYIHRQLDGTITDYAAEESVCLLKRATWFTQHLEVRNLLNLLEFVRKQLLIE
jgi:hypothetical protein